MTDILQGPAGNYYDKFNSRNPVTRRLMQGFKQDFLALFARTHAQHILELGCGEGHMLALMQQSKPQSLYGFDVDMGVLHDASLRCPSAQISLMDGHQLAFPDRAFDLVVACEVLEHVSNPARVLEEARRTTRRYGIFSVPREPLWRVLNMARGQYVGQLGNTPGHIQHWSSAGFVRLLSQYFEIIEVRQPLPWTMVLCALPIEESITR